MTLKYLAHIIINGLATVCFWCCLSVWVSAQTSESVNDQTYIINAYRLGILEEVALDGILDEPFWSDIIPSDNFTQQEPDEGQDPTGRTEIYVAYSTSHLCIGAKLFDSSPDGILAYQKRWDRGLGTDDRFM